MEPGKLPQSDEHLLLTQVASSDEALFLVVRFPLLQALALSFGLFNLFFQTEEEADAALAIIRNLPI